MTRGWLSIALACAFGALIGTLTALEISARFEYGSYLWSIGALVGGIAAYVAIDFRHFCAGVAHSYRRTVAWRPYGLWWKAFAAMSGGIIMIHCSIVGVWGATFAYVSDAPMLVTIDTLYVMLAASRNHRYRVEFHSVRQSDQCGTGGLPWTEMARGAYSVGDRICSAGHNQRHAPRRAHDRAVRCWSLRLRSLAAPDDLFHRRNDRCHDRLLLR